MNTVYEENVDSRASDALMMVYDGVKHTEIAEEFILPDYLPDIKKIVRVDTASRIDGKFVSKGKIDYEGDAVVNVLYVDEGNHLRVVTFALAFKDGVEIDDVIDECIANLIPDPESVICKTVNPRRISIRMRMDTAVTVWCKRDFEPVLDGAFYDGVEKSEKEVEVMKLVCAGESGLTVSADLEADGALPQIGEVISCNVDMSFYECKGSDGKVLCRGDMPITVFYSSPTDDGEQNTELYRKIPIAQVVLTDGTEDGCCCMARGNVDNVSVSVTENGFGERRIVQLDIGYRIYINCIEKDKVRVFNDVYAPGKDVKTETEKERFCRLSRIYNGSFSVNSVFTRDELNMRDTEGVFAVRADPKVTSVEKSGENGTVLVKGSAKVSAVVKNGDEMNALEIDVPFTHELECDVSDGFIYNYDIVCMNAKGRLDSENFYTELELALNLMLLDTEEAEVMKKAVFTDNEVEENRPQLRFYYPEDGETLWSIGKRFGVPIKELEEKNGIVEAELPRVLFIPTA